MLWVLVLCQIIENKADEPTIDNYIFFHYWLFEILPLEMWAKGHIMRPTN